MKKTLLFLSLSVLILAIFPVQSQEVTKVGTTAAGFLNIDVGARAIGMGSAFVAVADDATAMFWNPAGIARLERTQALFCHTRWIADVSFDYAAISLPVGNLGTVGLNATFLTMDEMEKTTVFEPNGTGEMFDAGSYAFGLAYGRMLTDRFSIGFNVKYIHEKIYHSAANGAAFDVGTMFDTQFNGIKIAMSIANYGAKMSMSGRDMLIQADIDPLINGNNKNINANLTTDKFDLPLMFRVGLSMDVLKGRGNSNLIISADALHPNDDTESANVGGEYIFNNMFALRAGYNSLFARDSEEGLSFGAGLQYKMVGSTTLHLDYAYQDFGVLNEVQMFNVGLTF
jgi:opacity protein-like surface antigen